MSGSSSTESPGPFCCPSPSEKLFSPLRDQPCPRSPNVLPYRLDLFFHISFFYGFRLPCFLFPLPFSASSKGSLEAEMILFVHPLESLDNSVLFNNVPLDFSEDDLAHLVVSKVAPFNRIAYFKLREGRILSNYYITFIIIGVDLTSDDNNPSQRGIIYFFTKYDAVQAILKLHGHPFGPRQCLGVKKNYIANSFPGWIERPLALEKWYVLLLNIHVLSLSLLCSPHLLVLRWPITTLELPIGQVTLFPSKFDQLRIEE